jgi:hypothetical protein
MGMYTGVRAKVKVKPEAYHVVEQLVSGSYWEDIKTDSQEIRNMIEDWLIADRYNLIPFGVLSYMPWDDNDPEWAHSFVDGIWTFQCSLKNYEDEIEYFFENILCYMITDIIHLEELYEEWDAPICYHFDNGKIIQN